MRREIIRLAKTGMSMRRIAREVGITDRTVAVYLRPYGGVIRPELWNPSSSRLSLDERVEIKVGLERGESLRAIGRKLGRDASTVCREVNAHGGPTQYKPMAARQAADLRARRPKPTKLSTNPRLCKRVASDLRWLYSPQQISQRLRQEFGDDPSMNVSHETILQNVVRAGQRRAKKGAHKVSAHWKSEAGPRWPNGDAWKAQKHGDDFRTPAGSSGPCGAGALGRRPSYGQGSKKRNRNSGREIYTLRHVVSSEERPLRRGSPQSDDQNHKEASRVAETELDLGSGQGDVRACSVSDRHRSGGLFLRSALTMAERFE